jgi:DNA-binding transcriptional ArsR family regulator
VKTTSRRIFGWAGATFCGCGVVTGIVRSFDGGRTTLRGMLHHPAVGEIRIEGVMHALSDPVRLQMVRSLAERDEPCACGAVDVPVSKSTRTHHWRVLRENGLIRQTEQGTAKLTELRRDDLEARFPGLLRIVLESASTPAEPVATLSS